MCVKTYPLINKWRRFCTPVLGSRLGSYACSLTVGGADIYEGDEDDDDMYSLNCTRSDALND